MAADPLSSGLELCNVAQYQAVMFMKYNAQIDHSGKKV